MAQHNATKIFNDSDFPIDISAMRDMTPQEAAEYEKSLRKIYHPTGINVFDLADMRDETPEEQYSLDRYIESISVSSGNSYYDDIVNSSEESSKDQ